MKKSNEKEEKQPPATSEIDDALPRVFVKEGCYCALKRVEGEKDEETGKPGFKYVEQKISNFTMTPVLTMRMVDSDEPVTMRSVKLVADNGFTVEAQIDAPSVSTKATFRGWLLACGNFHFFGTNAQAEAIMAETFVPGKQDAICRSVSGYDKGTGIWLFANCAMHGSELYELKDNLAGVVIGADRYLLDSGDAEASIRPPDLALDDMGNSKELLLRCMSATARLWGQPTEIVWGWFLSHLWRSRWLEVTHSFPLCCVSGPYGSGKSKFMQIACLLFGRTYQPANMSDSTSAGILTQVNRRCNVPMWFDEFKQDIRVEIREVLKGNYDATASTKGSLNTYRTRSRLHRGGIIVSGEVRPSDPALDSRCLDADIRTFENNQELFETTTHAAAGLSGYTVRLILEWEDLWALIRERYRVLCADWRQDRSLNPRIVENYAKVCATLDILLPDEKRSERFRQWLNVKVEDNRGTDVLRRMLELMPFYISNQRANIAFQLNTKKGFLAVHATNLTEFFFKQSQEPYVPIKQLIALGHAGKLLIEGHSPMPKQVRMKVPGGKDGTLVSQVQRCLLFDIKNTTVATIATELGAKDENDDSEEK